MFITTYDKSTPLYHFDGNNIEACTVEGVNINEDGREIYYVRMTRDQQIAQLPVESLFSDIAKISDQLVAAEAAAHEAKVQAIKDTISRAVSDYNRLPQGI